MPPPLPTNTPSSPPQAPGASPSLPELHDLKPLPEFHPIPFLLIFVLILLIVSLGIYLYWRYKRKLRKSTETVTADPPYSIALRETERLSTLRQQKNISVRELALGLSLILRRYLEKSASFPAEEQTAHEVISHLKNRTKRWQQASKDNLSTGIKAASSLLRFVDRAAFCEEPDIVYPLLGNHFDEAFSNLRSAIEEFELAAIAVHAREMEAEDDAAALTANDPGALENNSVTPTSIDKMV